jgi:hypothetical protein
MIYSLNTIDILMNIGYLLVIYDIVDDLIDIGFFFVIWVIN